MKSKELLKAGENRMLENTRNNLLRDAGKLISTVTTLIVTNKLKADRKDAVESAFCSPQLV